MFTRFAHLIRTASRIDTRIAAYVAAEKRPRPTVELDARDGVVDRRDNMKIRRECDSFGRFDYPDFRI